ncbi:hypothetical protein [Hoylesella shahii]|uniref:hypothetical protein n=1 Tax=Hoylesella shahii TaxID=228603 RepID=UPI0028E78ECC|nr:hypothetical protein [Hoylesella shahii]
MRNIDELTASLKAGECVLFNENGSEFRFKNLMEACKNATNHGRKPENGWNIVDDLGVTYENEDWGFLASLA